MRSRDQGSAFVEMICVLGMIAMTTFGIAVMAVITKDKAMLNAKISDSGQITVLKPKTELISIENSVKENELLTAPNVVQALTEMASESPKKPKAKVFEPGERHTTEAF